MNEEIKRSTQTIWDFHRVSDNLAHADIILGLGSIDIETAVKCTELYLEGLAPKIVFSGGIAHNDDLLKTPWEGTEAEAFAKEAISLGVPREDIILEDKATNTGENITFTYALLNELDLLPDSMIIVQKPYMGKRTFATFKKQWKDEKTLIMVTSPQIDIEDYLFSKENVEQEKIINLMVGDLDRIIKYPALGFQSAVSVPDSALKAMDTLVKAGYDKHLIV